MFVLPHPTQVVMPHPGKGTVTTPNVAGHRPEWSLETVRNAPVQKGPCLLHSLRESRVSPGSRGARKAHASSSPGGGRPASEHCQRPPDLFLKHRRDRQGRAQSRAESTGEHGAASSPARRCLRVTVGWNQPWVLWISSRGYVPHRPPGPWL